MLTIVSSPDVKDIIQQIYEQAEVNEVSPFLLEFTNDKISGHLIHGHTDGFEFRFWKVKSEVGIRFMRRAEKIPFWNLNIIVGTGQLTTENISYSLDGRHIFNSEFHNQVVSSESVFEGPLELYLGVYRISNSYLKQFACGNENISELIIENSPLAYYDIVSSASQSALKSILDKNEDSSFYEAFIEARIKLLLIIKLEKFWQKMASSQKVTFEHEYMKRMIGAVELFNDYNNPPTIGDIAKFVGLNNKKANSLFKQVYGTTPYQFFNDKRLEEAFDLITNSRLQISEIGIRLGFGNMSHFSKLFESKFNILPKKLQLQKRLK